MKTCFSAYYTERTKELQDITEEKNKVFDELQQEQKVNIHVYIFSIFPVKLSNLLLLISLLCATLFF